MKSIILTLISTLLIFCSCDKFDEDDVLTDGEKTAREVQNIVKKENITICDIYVYTTEGPIAQRYNQSFSFSGQFILVDGVYYNLDNLYKMSILNFSPKEIELYFR